MLGNSRRFWRRPGDGCQNPIRDWQYSSYAHLLHYTCLQYSALLLFPCIGPDIVILMKAGNQVVIYTRKLRRSRPNVWSKTRSLGIQGIWSLPAVVIRAEHSNARIWYLIWVVRLQRKGRSWGGRITLHFWLWFRRFTYSGTRSLRGGHLGNGQIATSSTEGHFALSVTFCRNSSGSTWHREAF